MPQSWVGKTLGGRYEIEALLGQGGMSAVYRATDPNLRRPVAIKLIHPHLSSNPDFVSRFKDEAAAVARLRHPHIVQVHDFNVDGDTYYMVMEYLSGETLQARLRRLNAVQRFMPTRQAIGICGQMAEAAGYAHAQGLIHRDIKPANIMLNPNDQAVLMDFGIVKMIGAEYHTGTGATIGTAMYMAPEQIGGAGADKRADIYSLGVTLYEMVSGRPPFQADSVPALLMMVLRDPLPDIQRFRQGVPPSLVAVLEKSLAKQPRDRFQTMDEMERALQPALEDAARAVPSDTMMDEELVEPAPAPGPAVAGAEASQLAPTELEAADAPQPLGLPRDGPAEAERKDEGKTDGASRPARLMPRPAPAPDQALSPGGEEAARPDRRRIIIAVAALLLVAVVAVGIVYMRAQAPPPVQMASVDQPVAPMDAQTAQLAVSLGRWETNSVIDELAYSPEGNLIATANNRERERFSRYRFYSALWQVDPASLRGYQLGHEQWVYSVAFSPDGQLFATGSDDDRVILWQAADGTLASSIDAGQGGIASVAFSPTYPILATGSSGGTVGLWQVSDGRLLRELQANEESVRDVEFSPDGLLLASASDDHAIRLWRVSDGSLVHTLRGHAESVRRVAFSPDGALLASASRDSTVGLWQVADGTLVRTLLGHEEFVLDVVFSADGSLLASVGEDGTLRLWQVSNGEQLRVLVNHPDIMTSVAFSPDGMMLVSAAADGVVQFWGLSAALPSDTETPDR